EVLEGECFLSSLLRFGSDLVLDLGLTAESLIRLGYKKENVKSLTGGYDEWKEGGFEVAGYDSSQKS
ncbi:12342_t:CDS:2, partial [Entrophospora sp. SA101]